MSALPKHQIDNEREILRPNPEVQAKYRDNPEARKKLAREIVKRYPIATAYLAR